MLESLTLKEFQKHQKLTINFDPSITCITGMNDAGKSAVLRALYWLTFNRPLDSTMVNWEAETATVKLVVDGRTIIRRKGKKNSYSLDGKLFKAFGAGVPPEISQLLNLEVTNFQMQKDPPFWLPLSPGQVSKELNQIVDLGIIDSSLAEVGSKLKKSKTKIEVLEDQLKEARLQRKQLKWTVDARKDMISLKEKEGKIERISSHVNQLQIYINDGIRYRNIQKNAVELAVGAQKSLIAYNKWAKINRQYQKLKQLVNSAEDKQNIITLKMDELEEVQKKINSIKKCPLCLQPINLDST